MSRSVGYVRLPAGTTADGHIRVSINEQSFKQCETYTTSDGQTWVSLRIKPNDLRKVLNGQKSITTIFQGDRA